MLKLLLLLILLIILFFVFLKEVLRTIDLKCRTLRFFIHKNSGIFTIFFMFLFFLEQISLLLCVYFFLTVSSQAQMIISIFALIVFTTAAFEKFILEKKYQYQKKEVDITSYENEKMLKEYKKMCEDYDILSLKYSKLKKKG